MNGKRENPMTSAVAERKSVSDDSSRAWAILRSTYHWLLSAAYFFPVCCFLVLLGIFVDPRRNDGPQRGFCRIIMKLAGARLVVAVRRDLIPTARVFC